MTMTEFHFSPRANRAHEIEWQPWSADAFARAEREAKPVLLSISAVWCHWCHVMDETSYSDPKVIETINARYVPVRIDNDERPDINARYNMGGWPTTAFLAPDGTTLTGMTYVPPEQMLLALNDIAEFFTDNRGDIETRAQQMRGARRSYEPALPEDLHASMVDAVAQHIAQGFDPEFGGFGDAPKFPQPEMLEFLLSEWRIKNDPQFYEMVVRTMREMARGGMYDHVEGGFFRYSTTRDWSVPHFEKMAEDHAGLVRVLAQLLIWAKADDLRDTLVSTLAYLRANLRDASTGFFAGSQDADEEYFALDSASRAKRTVPFIDRRSYTNWTAGLAGAFCWAAIALGDGTLATEAAATLDALHERMRDGDLLFHVIAPGGKPSVRGLLGDQVAYVRALLDAHETTGEPRFLDRAIAHARATIDRFGADDGGFYDHAAMEESLGRLDIRDRPVVDNGLFAEALLRIAALTGDATFRDAATRTLLLYAKTFANAGTFGATYARALRRGLSPESTIKIVGPVSETQAFRAAARALPNPLTTIRTLTPEDAKMAALPTTPSPAAYPCTGNSCGAPVLDPGGLI
jgi:uncharacterized protein YyaL (SSP411 family)